MEDNQVIEYIPIFVGFTGDTEKIVLYRKANSEELHIKRPDGELWAIDPGSNICIIDGLEDNEMRLQITSQAWSGEAIGSRLDVAEEEPIHV